MILELIFGIVSPITNLPFTEVLINSMFSNMLPANPFLSASSNQSTLPRKETTPGLLKPTSTPSNFISTPLVPSRLGHKNCNFFTSADADNPSTGRPPGGYRPFATILLSGHPPLDRSCQDAI